MNDICESLTKAQELMDEAPVSQRNRSCYLIDNEGNQQEVRTDEDGNSYIAESD